MDTVFHSFSQSFPRNLNKHIVLDHIRFAHEGISRADLARKMDISRAAISGIVNDLMAMDLLKEAQPAIASIGRRPMLLEINPRRGFVLGIDLGVTHLEILLADFSGRILAEFRQPLDIQDGPEKCLAYTVCEVERLLAENHTELQNVYAVGVGVPGPVIAQSGFVRQPPLMPGWDAFPIQETLWDAWQIPVSVNNNADLGVLGEWAFGIAQAEQNVVYIKIGSGIGAGLLLNGQIFHGQSGAAGEIGHITVKDDGELCECGNTGCLDTVASGNAIARRAVKAAQSGQETLLRSYLDHGQITPREVALAAEQGDQIARQIILEAGFYIGQAVASLINLINPGLVVIGGGVTQIGDLLLEPIRHSVQQRCLSASAESVRITIADLEPRSTSMGAVALALDVALHLIMEG